MARGAARRLKGLRITLDVVEVGVVEAGGVFEAEAKHTVEADVADPDGGEGKQNGFGFEEANRDERRWSEIGVGEVVAGGSEADADEIAEHEEIGCKEEHGEEEPTGVEVAVEENGRKKNESAFDLKQEFGSGHIASVTLKASTGEKDLREPFASGSSVRAHWVSARVKSRPRKSRSEQTLQKNLSMRARPQMETYLLATKLQRWVTYLIRRACKL